MSCRGEFFQPRHCPELQLAVDEGELVAIISLIIEHQTPSLVERNPEDLSLNWLPHPFCKMLHPEVKQCKFDLTILIIIHLSMTVTDHFQKPNPITCYVNINGFCANSHTLQLQCPLVQIWSRNICPSACIHGLK